MVTVLVCLFLLAAMAAVKFAFHIITLPFRILRRIFFGKRKKVYYREYPYDDDWDFWMDGGI